MEIPKIEKQAGPDVNVDKTAQIPASENEQQSPGYVIPTNIDTGPSAPDISMYDEHNPILKLAEAKNSPMTEWEVKQSDDSFLQYMASERNPASIQVPEYAQKKDDEAGALLKGGSIDSAVEDQKQSERGFAGKVLDTAVGAVKGVRGAIKKSNQDLENFYKENNLINPGKILEGQDPLQRAGSLAGAVSDKGEAYSQAIVYGTNKMVEKIWNGVVSAEVVADNWLKEQGIDPEGKLNAESWKYRTEDYVPAPTSTDEKAVAVLSEYVTGGMLWLKAINASVRAAGALPFVGKYITKLATGPTAEALKPSAAGAATAVTLMDPKGERLADVMDHWPVLRYLVPPYMKSRPDDTEADARLKNGIEGMFLGVAGEALFSLLKVWRNYKQTQDVLTGKDFIVPPQASAEMQAAKNVNPPLTPETQAAQKYQYSPMDVSQPTEGKVFYHGSKKGLSSIEDARPTETSNPNNLYGNGIYLTDNKDLAVSYTGKKGNVVAGKLGNLKLLDLEKPLPENVFKVFEESLPYGMNTAPFASFRGKPGKEVFAEFKAYYSDAETTTSEMMDVYQGLNTSLQKEGFDGLRHEGGNIVGGKGNHNVVILFDDPQTLSVKGKISNYVEPPQPPKAPETLPATTTTQAASNVEKTAQKPLSLSTISGEGPPVTIRRTSPKQYEELQKSAFSDVIIDGEHEINIDLGRITQEKDIKGVLNAVADTFEKEMVLAKGGVRSDKIVQDIGELNAINPQEMLSKGLGAVFTDREIFGLKKLLIAAARDWQVKARAAVVGGVKERASAILATDKLRFLQAIATGARAEAGRALRQWGVFKESVDGFSMNSIQDLVESWGKDYNKMFERADTLTSPRAVLEAVKISKWKKYVSDPLRFIQVNGLLSGPHTHMKNFISNTMSTLAGPLEESFGASLSNKINQYNLHTIGPDEVKLAVPLKIEYGHAGAQYMAMIDSMGEAFSVAAESLRTGSSSWGLQKAGPDFLASARYGLRAETVGGNALESLKGFVSLPSRFLMSSDDFFKVLNYRASLELQAIRSAEAQGLVGKEFNDFVYAFKRNPTTVMENEATSSLTAHDIAYDYAHERTYTAPLTGSFGSIENTVRMIPGARFVLPFMKTNMNVVTYNLERSVFAPLMPTIRADLAAGGVRASYAQGKMAIGMGMAAVAMKWAAEGRITGRGYANPEARAIQKKNGFVENAIFDPQSGTYKKYDPNDPFFFILGKVADAMDVLKEMDDPDSHIQEMLVPLVGIIMEHVTPEFIVDAMGKSRDLLGVLSGEGKGKAFEKTSINIASSFLPFSGMLRASARSADPTIRDITPNPRLNELERIIDGVLTKWGAETPKMSKEYPPLLNMFAEPWVGAPGYGRDSFSALYTGKVVDDPVYKELERLGVSGRIFNPPETPENQHLIIKMPPRVINRDQYKLPPYKLTSKEYNTLIKYINKIDIPKEANGHPFMIGRTTILPLKEKLRKEISEGYPSLGRIENKTDNAKRLVLKEIINSYYQGASDIFILLNPYKTKELDKAYLMEAGNKYVESMGISRSRTGR